jgi:hypothetical protein
MSALTPIIALLAIIWFWLDSLRAREIATGVCRAACAQRDVQFLDQTVALRRLGVRWRPEGLRLRRVYRFDYSEEGLGRATGHIVMIGRMVEDLSMGLPQRPVDR